MYVIFRMYRKLQESVLATGFNTKIILSIYVKCRM